MIREIRVQNFKSLRDVTVELDPVTVLIGRSGSGKTNFVFALRFLRDYLTQRDVDFIKAWGGWSGIVCATMAPDTNRLVLEVRFDVPGVKGDFVYNLSFLIRRGTPPVANFRAESLVVNGDLLYGQDDGKWTKTPEVVEPPNPGQPVLGLLYGIREAKIAYLALTQGIGCYDLQGNVMSAGRFVPSDGTDLKDSAENYLVAFDAITNNLADLESVKDILAALQRLNPSVASVEIKADRSQILVSHQVGNQKIISFDLAQESEGFRRVLAHLIALYQRPHKQTLAIEEPEKGVYPGALAVLAEYFQAAAAHRRSQVILTTHSPQLLGHFSPQQIRVVEMDGYETQIGTMAPEQREAIEDHLMTADELLTVDEARMAPDSPSLQQS